MAEDVKFGFEFDDGGLFRGFQKIENHLKDIQDELRQYDRFQKKTVRDGRKDVLKYGDAWRKTNKDIWGSIGILKSLAGLAGGVLVGVGVGSFVKDMADAAIQAEQTEVAFTTLFGSVDEGKKALEELNKFSIETPLRPDQVIEAGKSLKAFGFETNEIVPALKNVGDIASGVGTDFNELALIYGKARTSGKLFSEDLNQLVERGIPVLDELAKQFGVTKGEVKKLASEGKIEFSNLEESFKSLTGEGGTFFNLMEKQSQTVAGRISTLQGNFQALQKTTGQLLIPAISDAVDILNVFVQSIDPSSIKEFFSPIGNLLLPALEELYNSFSEAVNIIFGFNDETSKGIQIGELLASAFEFIVKEATATTKVITGVIEGFNNLYNSSAIVRGVIDGLREAVGFLLDKLEGLYDWIIGVGDETEKTAESNNKLKDSMAASKKELEENAKQLEHNANNLSDIEKKSKEAGNSAKKFSVQVAGTNKELEKLNAEYTKLVSNIQEKLFDAELDNLAPKDRIKEEEKRAIEELNLLEQTTRERAKALKKSFDLEDEFNRLRELTRTDSAKRLSELEQSQLNDRLSNLDLQEEINAAELQSTQFTATQLLNIEEIKQRELLRLQKETVQAKFKEIEGATGAEMDLLRAQLVSEINGINNEVAAINKRAFDRRISEAETLALQEIDLLEESGNKLLDLEEYKEQQRFEVQIKFAKQRLALLKAEKGEDSFEVEQLENEIAKYEKNLQGIGEIDLTFLEGFKQKLIEGLGITPEEFEFLAEQVANIAGGLVDGWVNGVDTAIDENQRLIDALDEQITAQEEAVSTQLERQKDGLANNVAAEKKSLNELLEQRKAAQKKSEQLQKQAARREAIAATAQQTISLITAAANIFKGASNIPLVGVAIALGLVGVMMGAFARFKKTASQSATKLFKGGRIPLNGRDDKHGRGHQVEDTNIVVGRGEWVVESGASNEHDRFLYNLNAGKYKGMDLEKMAETANGARIAINSNLQEAEKVREKVIEVKREREEIIMRETIEQAFKNVITPEFDRLIKSQNEKPDRLTLNENSYLEIAQKGNVTTRRKINLPT